MAGGQTLTYNGDSGPAISAGLAATSPASIAVDGSGNLYVLDVGRVRKVDTSGTINPISGNGGNGYGGDGGSATSATIAADGFAVDSVGTFISPTTSTIEFAKWIMRPA